MGLTTAERNKRKRERKKREREERLKREKEEAEAAEKARQEANEEKEEDDEEVEIEYVAEPLFTSLTENADPSNPAATTTEEVKKEDGEGEEEKKEDIESVLRRFHLRSSVSAVVSDDETARGGRGGTDNEHEQKSENDNASEDEDDDEEATKEMSKRKQREMNRPSVAELKRRVKRADLVEAHDVTAADPDFLIYLKSVNGTVPVPRHWGRKRKYLQGKRGIEKAPFTLPDFLVKTGICEIRDSTAEDESKMSTKQRNRARVAPRMGGTDVDYRTLYDAFFKHQTKPKSLTKFGDLYYEGKEFETRKSSHLRPGILSETLREALGMTEGSPPPWLINMQRYGPPPSYPNLKIPGLNAPLPEGCSYGYHLNGWGKPPVDAFGRPLYGGDPFGRTIPEGGVGADGGGAGDDGLLFGDAGGAAAGGGLVTSDGKALGRKPWGALPTAADEEEEESSEEEEEEESSDEEMAESEEEEEEGEEEKAEEEGKTPSGAESVLPDGVDSVAPTSAIDLRKQPGDETPAAPKSLYTVLDQTAADKEKQAGAVFASNVQYVLPGSGGVPADGAESILAKAPMDESGKRKRSKMEEDEDADELGKKFKF